MQTTRRTLLTATLGAGATLAAASVLPSPTAGARLVRAYVRRDGVVLLQGSTSDDGYPDADAVWGYLEELLLRPTEAFAELLPEGDVAEFTLSSDDDEGRPVQRRVELEIAYGGWAFPHTLPLVRTGTDRQGNDVWRVDPDVVERHARLRYIRREQAARLERK